MIRIERTTKSCARSLVAIALTLAVCIAGVAPITTASSGILATRFVTPDDFECVGALTGVIPGNVVVPPGATCFLFEANVQGNVTVLEGASLVADGNTILGNIEGVKSSSMEILFNTVHGNISLTKGGAVSPGFFTFCGNNLPDGDIHVSKSVGDFAFGRGAADCPGNTLGNGNIEVEKNTVIGSLQIRRNNVGSPAASGNLEVSKNVGPGPKVVAGNTVFGDLRCKQNDPPFASGFNAARESEGQCAGADPLP